MKDSFDAFLGIFVALVTASLLLGALLALPVMWLWNACLVPAVTGLREIEFLQAWGLLILCNLLFHTSITVKK